MLGVSSMQRVPCATRERTPRTAPLRAPSRRRRLARSLVLYHSRTRIVHERLLDSSHSSLQSVRDGLASVAHQQRRCRVANCIDVASVVTCARTSTEWRVVSRVPTDARRVCKLCDVHAHCCRAAVCAHWHLQGTQHSSHGCVISTCVSTAGVVSSTTVQDLEMTAYSTLTALMHSHLLSWPPEWQIVAPDGWFERSYALEDLEQVCAVTKPVSQHVAGKKGIFNVDLVERKSLSVREFKTLADTLGASKDEPEDLSDVDSIERQFWKSLRPTMDAPVYGADIVVRLCAGLVVCMRVYEMPQAANDADGSCVCRARSLATTQRCRGTSTSSTRSSGVSTCRA